MLRIHICAFQNVIAFLCHPQKGISIPSFRDEIRFVRLEVFLILSFFCSHILFSTNGNLCDIYVLQEEKDRQIRLVPFLFVDSDICSFFSFSFLLGAFTGAQ